MEQAIPRMLSEKQAAEILCVSVAALRRWRRERRGPQFARLERCVRYDLRSLERFVTENSSTKGMAAGPGSTALGEVRND
jgi:Helix-turn-helix domain